MVTNSTGSVRGDLSDEAREDEWTAYGIPTSKYIVLAIAAFIIGLPVLLVVLHLTASDKTPAPSRFEVACARQGGEISELHGGEAHNVACLRGDKVLFYGK